VVGVAGGLIVALFALLKACDCGFRCRRRRVCGRVTVCCCIKLQRLPTLPPGDAAGIYRPLDIPVDDGQTPLAPNTQYVLQRSRLIMSSAA
jgi:hypothetical protein